MFNIATLNNISSKGLDKFEAQRFKLSENTDNADALLLRSAKIHDMEFPDSIKCVGRAGAGTNNIPVDKLTEMGIPVFNTPGANANAVKELVVTGLLLASRNICQAWQYVNNLQGDDATLSQQIEARKKQYVGYELPGRTLGVIGLGAIGVKVANVAIALGMKVIGYDPRMTIENAWQLSPLVKKAPNVKSLLAHSDFISLHIPLNDHTKGFMNAEMFAHMKANAVLLNFARGGVVHSQDLLAALNNNLHAYVCDFPSNDILNHEKVIALPHLGASTKEAEENCAMMIVDQVKDFLFDGNIKNSVNFPETIMPRSESDTRLCIINKNIPNMVAQISSVLAEQKLNISHLLNNSRGDIACTLIDLDAKPSDVALDALVKIEGVISARICE